MSNTPTYKNSYLETLRADAKKRIKVSNPKVKGGFYYRMQEVGDQPAKLVKVAKPGKTSISQLAAGIVGTAVLTAGGVLAFRNRPVNKNVLSNLQEQAVQLQQTLTDNPGLKQRLEKVLKNPIVVGGTIAAAPYAIAAGNLQYKIHKQNKREKEWEEKAIEFNTRANKFKTQIDEFKTQMDKWKEGGNEFNKQSKIEPSEKDYKKIEETISTEGGASLADIAKQVVEAERRVNQKSNIIDRLGKALETSPVTDKTVSGKDKVKNDYIENVGKTIYDETYESFKGLSDSKVYNPNEVDEIFKKGRESAQKYAIDAFNKANEKAKFDDREKQQIVEETNKMIEKMISSAFISDVVRRTGTTTFNKDGDSKRRGNQVFVKDPSVKGGGYWRELPKKGKNSGNSAVPVKALLTLAGGLAAGGALATYAKVWHTSNNIETNIDRA